MAILQSDKLLWYHPCDSFTDADGNVWVADARWGGTMTVSSPGKVGDCFRTGPSLSNVRKDGMGETAAAASRLTCASWTNWGAGGGGRCILGLAEDNLGPTDWGAIDVYQTGKVVLYHGAGTSEVLPAASISPTTVSTWIFYVIDLERSGADWICRWSANGSAWTAGAPVTAPALTGAGDDRFIFLSTTETRVDDAAVWKNADLFTSTELANLYDLGATFGDGLDQYSQNYEGAPICWQATARMPDGSVWRDSGSGPCPPVVRVPQGAVDVVVTDDGRPVAPRVVEG